VSVKHIASIELDNVSNSKRRLRVDKGLPYENDKGRYSSPGGDLYLSTDGGSSWERSFHISDESAAILYAFVRTGWRPSNSDVDFLLRSRLLDVCLTLQLIDEATKDVQADRKKCTFALADYVLGESSSTDELKRRIDAFLRLYGTEELKAEEPATPAAETQDEEAAEATPPRTIIQDGNFVNQTAQAVKLSEQLQRVLLQHLPDCTMITQLQDCIHVQLPAHGDLEADDLAKLMQQRPPGPQLVVDGVKVPHAIPTPASIKGYCSLANPRVQAAAELVGELDKILASAPHPALRMTTSLRLSKDKLSVSLVSPGGENELLYDYFDEPYNDDVWNMCLNGARVTAAELVASPLCRLFVEHH
jgi:hypothetical protein